MTKAALDWQLARRGPIGKADLVFLGETGHPLYHKTKGGNANQTIPNRWDSLLDKVCKDHPDFRRLSFGKLRKTGSTLIRRIGPGYGEIASLFLAHGQPVKSDDLLEVYASKPWGLLVEALDKLWEKLGPHFVGESPQDGSFKRGGGNISLGTREKILELHSQGKGVSAIADELGVSRNDRVPAPS